MPRSPRSTRPYPRSKHQSTSAARSVAGPADRRSGWSPTGAEGATPDAPAPIAEGTTRPQDAVSGPEGLDAEWRRLWEAAPESVRWAFAKCLNRLAMPRPILYDNFTPVVERRVDAMLTLYARRLLENTPRGGR